MREHFQKIIEPQKISLRRLCDYVSRRVLQFTRLVYTLHIFFSLNTFFKSAHPSLKRHRYRIVLLKYIRNYLSKPLDSSTRAEILVHHYRFMLSHMTSQFIDGVMSSCITLWQDNGNQYRVTLAYPRKDQEGDLSLEFLAGSVPLCNLSFTFVPGQNLGLADHTLLFISRLQGSPGQFDAIREATRRLDDVSLFSILFTAAQAIANVLDVGIAAITAQHQTVVGNINSGSMYKHRYDTMWESFGGTRTRELFYTLPATPNTCDRATSSKKHKSKRVHQRAFKMSLFHEAAESFSHYRLDIPEDK